jgi:LCP family protein required for cell wall assembly
VSLAVLASYTAILQSRVHRLQVDLHRGEGTTWVIVGLDSRAHLPTGASITFGTVHDVPGARADVVLVLHIDDGGRTTALSVPRDVVVSTPRGPSRLALTWLGGPQATVDALCGLGIPADHLVAVDLAGFATVVDAVGGVDVDVAEPVRDLAAGLLVEQAGRQHVDAATALALVRSRHPEQLVAGVWTPAPEDADGRATEAGAVLRALGTSARTAWPDPRRLHSLAWAVSGVAAVDASTSPSDLATLVGADLATVSVLPVGDPFGGTLARFPDDETSAALRAAGLACQG